MDKTKKPTKKKDCQPSDAISNSMDSTDRIPLNSINSDYDSNDSSFIDFDPNTNYQNLIIKSTTISSTSQMMKFSNHTTIDSHMQVSSHQHTLDDHLIRSSSISSSSSPDSPLGYHQNRRVLPGFLEGSHANTPDPSCNSMSTDSGNKPSNDSSNENGFAEWGSTSGTSFLKEFEESTDDLLNIFNNINHIKPPDLVFPMQQETSNSALSAPPQPNRMVSSPRTRELLPTEMIEENERTDPRRAKRIITNRRTALKANDKKKRYISELEGRIHILRTKSDAYKSELIMLEKKKDALQNEQDIMGKSLKCIVGEVHLQEKINHKVSEDVQNLREVLGLKPTDDVMQLARRMIPALNQPTQPSANSSAQQREMHRLVEQFLWLRDQAPNQHRSSHYQASQLMGTLRAAQLPQPQLIQGINQQPQSLHQAPQLIQNSSIATQHIPIQSSSSQLQLHSSRLIMYNTRRNNQSSSSTRVYAQEHCYRLKQFARRKPLRLPNQQRQLQQQQDAPPT